MLGCKHLGTGCLQNEQFVVQTFLRYFEASGLWRYLNYFVDYELDLCCKQNKLDSKTQAVKKLIDLSIKSVLDDKILYYCYTAYIVIMCDGEWNHSFEKNDI